MGRAVRAESESRGIDALPREPDKLVTSILETVHLCRLLGLTIRKLYPAPLSDETCEQIERRARAIEARLTLSGEDE